MRAHVERARDSGVDLGLFSGNTSYWQVARAERRRRHPGPHSGWLQGGLAHGPDHAGLPEDDAVSPDAGESA